MLHLLYLFAPQRIDVTVAFRSMNGRKIEVVLYPTKGRHHSSIFKSIEDPFKAPRREEQTHVSTHQECRYHSVLVRLMRTNKTYCSSRILNIYGMVTTLDVVLHSQLTSGHNGRKSCAIEGRSRLSLILGFPAKIQNTSNASRVGISVSMTEIVHLMPK